MCPIFRNLTDLSFVSCFLAIVTVFNEIYSVKLQATVDNIQVSLCCPVDQISQLSVFSKLFSVFSNEN